MTVQRTCSLRRLLVALAVLPASGFWSAAAGAQVYYDGECELLSEVARREALETLNALRGDQPQPVPPIKFVTIIPHICGDATRATTGGFAAAMAQSGLPIRWSYGEDGPHCDGQNLTQCFPMPDPAAVPLTIDDQLLLNSAWRSVRDRVIATMQWGAGSDLSYFSASGLPDVPWAVAAAPTAE